MVINKANMGYAQIYFSVVGRDQVKPKVFAHVMG